MTAINYSRSDERARGMRELKLHGLSVTEIAQKYGLKQSTVSMAIIRYEQRYDLPNSSEVREPSIPKQQRTNSIVREPGIRRRKRTSSIPKPEAEERALKFRTLKLQGVTLDEIGTHYNLTRERVRQIIVKYEKRHNLPSSTQVSRQIIKAARTADIKEYKEEQRLEKQKNFKRFVPCFQLDTHLIGKFLKDLGEKAILYGFDGKSRRKPRTNKDGVPYPSMNKPTNIFISNGGRHITVHAWVLKQYEITLEKGQICHHKDGDVTNNMLENLEVLSNSEHGRITMQEQLEKGTIDYQKRSVRRAALTESQVEEIRRQYQPRVVSIAQLAKKYGVADMTMHNAVHGLATYKHVSPHTRHPLDHSHLIQNLSTEQEPEQLTFWPLI